MDLKGQLQALIQGEVSDNPQTLETYSKDASIFEIKPQLVIAPKNSQDIKALIDYINSHPDQHLSLTPRAAGTDMSGGPLNDSIILDMTEHFNQIIKVGDDRATVQPGVYYRDFEKVTLKKDLLLPCYTASREINTVGGMVGNNSAGEKSLTYGQTEQWVEELKVVLADGNEYLIKPLTKTKLQQKIRQRNFEGRLYKQIFELINDNLNLIISAKPAVSKNTAGYYLWNVWDPTKGIFDLTKLIVGSQGTLGIITEIKFKLIRPTNHAKTLVIFLQEKNLPELGDIVNRILTYRPESFESYDDNTLKIATKYLPEVLRVMKVRNLLSLAWSFIPEVIMAVLNGFPKLVLIAEFTGSNETKVEQNCLAAQLSIKKYNLNTRVSYNEEDAKKYWTIRRESFNLLRHHSQNLRTAPFIDDIVVSPDKLPEFLPKLKQILNKYKLIYTIAGHVGNGNFHIIPLMDFTNSNISKIIKELSDAVFDLVLEFKGSITAEHNDGLIRSPYLPKMYGEEVYQLFKKVKTIFDSQNIFNPHKKTDGTFEYSFNQIVDHHNQLHPSGS